METEALLQMTPADALVAMVNYENRTAFRPGAFNITELMQLNGTTTQVLMTSRRPWADLDVVPDPGSFLFVYERLNVADHFASVLGGYRPAMPTSTQALLDEITRRTGQLFYPDDFELDYIDRDNADPYTLRAKPESLRWVGTIAVTLGDYPDLSTYLADATPQPYGQVSEAANLATQPVGFSTINATSQRAVFPLININERAQNNTWIPLLFNQVIAQSPQYVQGSTHPWTVSTTPGPYNLYNARVVSKTQAYVHPNNPLLDTAIVVDLDLAYCTNFTEARVYLPYQASYEAPSQFAARPRFRSSGVRSMSDGSAHRVFLNTLVTGDVIITLPSNGLQLSGPIPWVCNAGVLSKTNLYNAIVQYNGQRRSQDIPPAGLHLNRVLVVTIDEAYNAAYQGNLSFHYRAPIMVQETIPPARVAIAYSFDFAPSEGTAPYAIAVVAGVLPAGLSLVGNKIEGTATVRGNYSFTIEVSDAANIRLRYAFRMTVLD